MGWREFWARYATLRRRMNARASDAGWKAHTAGSGIPPARTRGAH